MLGRVALAIAVVGVGACGGDGAPGADDKRIRRGATATLVGDLVWVAGGAEGTGVELAEGRASPVGAVVASDLDGNEVATLDLELGGGDGLTEVAVVDAGDGRVLVVGGRCLDQGFGCAGRISAYAALLDPPDPDADDGAGAVDVVEIGDQEGAARVAGVAGGAAWLVANTFEPRLVRVDLATGEADVSELPPFAFTGGQCAGPDGVVAGVADRDEDFAAHGLELLRRGTGPDDAWTSVGIVPFEARRPSRIDLHCLGGGEVLAAFREDDGRAVLLDLDGGRALDPPPAELEGALTSVVDPATGVAVVAPIPRGAPVPVWAHAPGGGWVELGAVAGQATSLGIVDGEVLDVAGAAVVPGGAPVPVGGLPSETTPL